MNAGEQVVEKDGILGVLIAGTHMSEGGLDWEVLTRTPPKLNRGSLAAIFSITRLDFS